MCAFHECNTCVLYIYYILNISKVHSSSAASAYRVAGSLHETNQTQLLEQTELTPCNSSSITARQSKTAHYLHADRFHPAYVPGSPYCVWFGGRQRFTPIRHRRHRHHHHHIAPHLWSGHFANTRELMQAKRALNVLRDVNSRVLNGKMNTRPTGVGSRAYCAHNINTFCTESARERSDYNMLQAPRRCMRLTQSLFDIHHAFFFVLLLSLMVVLFLL